MCFSYATPSMCDNAVTWFSRLPSSLAVRWVTRRREGTPEPRWSESRGPRPWCFQQEKHLVSFPLLYGHSYCTCSLKQSTISILLLSPLPHHQELDSQMDQKPWKDLVMVPSEQKGKGLAKDKILHPITYWGVGGTR